MIQLQYRRTRNNGQDLELWVNEGDKWIHYRQSKFYKSDATMSSQSGFATSQAYLNLGATFLPLEDK